MEALAVSSPSVAIPLAEGVDASSYMEYHNVVLQTLDVFVPSALSESKRMFYPFGAFEGTEHDWNGKWMIYTENTNSPQHIDWDKFLKDPDKELRRNNARIVGICQGATVASYGSKRLEASPIIWDAAVNAGIARGEVGISTEFFCDWIDESLVGKVKPRYVYLFPMLIANEQNDIGARFMNTASNPVESRKNEDIVMDAEFKSVLDEQKGVLNSLLDAIKGFTASISRGAHTNTAPSIGDGAQTMDAVAPQTGNLAVAPSVPVEFIEKLQGLEAATAEKDTKIAEMEAQIKAFAEAEEARKVEAENARLAALENEWQTKLVPKFPAGLLHDEAKAADIKKMFIEDPRNFVITYSEYINKTDIDASAGVHANTSGQTHSNTSVGAKVEEDAIPTIGSFNAATGKFE